MAIVITTPPSDPPLLLQPPVVQQPPAPLAAPRVIDLVTATLSALTGIPPTLVRPRWQPTPPQQPTAGTSWAAVGVTRRLATGYTHQVMSCLPGTETPALLLRRWAALTVLCSFYGPVSEDLAEQFRDGLYIVQNLSAWYINGLKLTEVGEVLAVPDLTNWQWIDHQDVRLELVREFDRYYPLQSLVEGDATINADLYSSVVILP